jgi:hypothetical protein
MSGSTNRNADVRQVVDAIHKQGGIFQVNHPASEGDAWLYTTDGVDAIEVWNTAWAWGGGTRLTSADVASRAAGYGVAAPELERAVASPAGGPNAQALRYWEEFLQQGKKIAATGGGDRHGFVMPGNPTTRVFAASPSQADILDGIRKGRTVVMRRPDACEVDFTADGNQDGVFETIVGGSAPLGGPVTFKMHIVDCEGGMVDLVKNGQVIQRWSIPAADFEVTFTETPGAKSWYRLDVYEPLDMSIPQASTLKYLVLGFTGQSWVNNLSSGFLANILGFLSGWVLQIQDVVDTGGPAAAWLLINGQQMGVQISPVGSRYPTIEVPEAVSRILNVDMVETDFARGAITSPIWVE